MVCFLNCSLPSWAFLFRKVAACSGDVRRALDICRRASEVVVEGCPVTMPIINQVLSQMMNSANVCSIK